MPPQVVANTMIATPSSSRSDLKLRHNGGHTFTTTANTNTNTNTTTNMYHNTHPEISKSRTDDADIAAGVTVADLNVITSPSSKTFDHHPINSVANRDDNTNVPHGTYNLRQQQQHHHQQQQQHRDNTNYDQANKSYYDQNGNYEKQNILLGSETDSAVSLSLEEKINDTNKFHFNTDYYQREQSSSPSTTTPSSNNNTTQIKDQILILGINISNLPRKSQFYVCAIGVFSFSLLYGYLQELISVTLCNRQLGLFLGMMQFFGYAIWSRIFHLFVQSKQKHHHQQLLQQQQQQQAELDDDYSSSLQTKRPNVPMKYYILLSILRAIDAGMTNMAMAYVNYPAKTLMKSSRVVFTMLFGALIRRKRYKVIDYIVVLLMVSGLVLFMHADSKSSAIFQPLGIMMLTTSLLCDGAVNNMSEAIMTQYNVGQDEFIYHLYSIAVIGIAGAAYLRGDLNDGIRYMVTPGTWDEIQGNEIDVDVRSWSVMGKFMALFLFSSAGFFGSSCSALITKEFGALTMSITSTARKAMTLFLSFALFKENICTLEHLSGIVLFITALVAKSLRASGGCGKSRNRKKRDSIGGGKGHDDNDDEESEEDDEMASLMPQDEAGGNDGIELAETTPSVSSSSTTSVKRRFRSRKRNQANIASIV